METPKPPRPLILWPPLRTLAAQESRLITRRYISPVFLRNHSGSASDVARALNALWKEWRKKEIPEGWNVYALLWPSNDKWLVALCSQKIAGGLLYKLEKSMGSKSIEEMDFPKQTCALIPISDVFDRIGKKLSQLLG